MINFIFLTVIFLIIIGLFGTMFKKNLIKLAMSINIISNGVNLFLISLGYRQGGIAPIFTNAPNLKMVSPTPQALILTNIVINLAVTAFLLSLSILIYKKEKKL
ncbi:MAG: cation:proton antiporter [Xanthomonadaceae bacterium]|nr:cation:proton antiporter [Rhodospirillaceae bacterium]NIA17746.1 cation:proton antiporter [Xanthomonadaceae bacterium]